MQSNSLPIITTTKVTLLRNWNKNGIPPILQHMPLLPRHKFCKYKHKITIGLTNLQHLSWNAWAPSSFSTLYLWQCQLHIYHAHEGDPQEKSPLHGVIRSHQHRIIKRANNINLIYPSEVTPPVLVLGNSTNTRSIILPICIMYGYNSGWYPTSSPMLRISYTVLYLLTTKVTFLNYSCLLLEPPILCLSDCPLCLSSNPLKHNKILRVTCTYLFRICIPTGKQWL